MFQKHITTNPTGDVYERGSSGSYYRIFEVENARYIDPDKYIPYLEWIGTPEEVNTDLVELTEDQKWDQIRQQRNNLLAQCDWTQLPDVPLTPEQVITWREYRQALRDVTEQADPDNIIWPLFP